MTDQELEKIANEFKQDSLYWETSEDSRCLIEGFIKGYKKAEGEYKADAESWRALEEKLTDCNLSLHDKGKSIELLINRK